MIKILQFKVEIIDDVLNIVSDKEHYFNCTDKTDMIIFCNLINDEICYLNETGADSERIICNIEKMINDYKNKVIR